jgi:hypothetical protein
MFKYPPRANGTAVKSSPCDYPKQRREFMSVFHWKKKNIIRAPVGGPIYIMGRGEGESHKLNLTVTPWVFFLSTFRGEYHLWNVTSVQILDVLHVYCTTSTVYRQSVLYSCYVYWLCWPSFTGCTVYCCTVHRNVLYILSVLLKAVLFHECT